MDRQLDGLFKFHTEKCCNLQLSAAESDRHKEARALAKSLLGFFDKEELRAREELKQHQPKP